MHEIVCPETVCHKTTRHKTRRHGSARQRRMLAVLLILAISLAACAPDDGTPDPVPTLVDLDTLPTANFLTQNAPPAGFGVVSFDPLDANLAARPGWRYTVVGEFDGTFAESGEPATGRFEAAVWANELGEARRVVLSVDGRAVSPQESVQLEGVRISNDTYVVDTNGQCTPGDAGSSVVADLSAGQLVGSVVNAVPTGHRDTIDGVPVWQYTFAPEDLTLAAVKPAGDNRVDVQANLWIAPSLNAVVRFEATVEVENVRILSAEQAVSGTLFLTYTLDLSQIDSQPNISIPNGC